MKNRTLIGGGTIALLILAGGFFVWSRQSQTPSSTNTSAGDMWVEMKPIQCLQNPWEVDWVAAHSGIDYPRGDLNIIEPAEKEIITAYYALQSIPILEVASLPPSEGAVTCLACMCAQGYTLKLRVPVANEETMKALGYSPSE